MTQVVVNPPGGARIRATLAVVMSLQSGAAILFALSQLIWVMDPSWMAWIAPLDGLFRSDNLAVTVLLATEGFFVAALLVEPESARRSVARVGAHIGGLWLLLALVCLVAIGIQHFDSTFTGSADQTQDAVLHILTFSWNDWIADQPLGVRADLVSLWYFSISVQLTVALTVVGLVLRRWPRLFGVALVLAAVASTAYRNYLLDQEGWFGVALSTYARADAFLVGAAVAFLVPVLSGRVGSGLTGGGLLVLVGLVISTSFLDVDEIFRYIVPATAATTALFIAGARSALDHRALAVGLLTAKEALMVGRAWPDLVAWSGIVVLTVQRHTTGQPASGVTMTALVAVVIVVTISRASLDRSLAALAGAVDGHRRKGPVGRRRAELVGSGAEPGPEDRGAGSEPPADA